MGQKGMRKFKITWRQMNLETQYPKQDKDKAGTISEGSL